MKFSAHNIVDYPYLEPIGDFHYSIRSFVEVLSVSIFGGLGIFFAQLFFYYFNPKVPLSFFKLEKSSIKVRESLIVILMLIVAVISLYINHNFNILVMGVRSSIELPFKGNIIFFLFVVRAIPFLFFYFLLERLSFRGVLFGGIIAVICSVAVLSRMITIIFFITLLIVIFQRLKELSNREVFKLATSFLVLFSFFSYLTVVMSTKTREDIVKELSFYKTSIQREIASAEQSQFNRYFRKYMSLAVDRWIGIEGVMAVQGYDQKGWNLLLDGLREKSYRGRSFYSKISFKHWHDRYSKEDKLISTSVPGPVAFSYYTGSKFFTFIFMLSCVLVLGFICSSLANLVGLNAGSYIGVFVAFDFFQFGISPTSFVKYLLFSVFCILLFQFILKKISVRAEVN
jgi:hypothetical protein